MANRLKKELLNVKNKINRLEEEQEVIDEFVKDNDVWQAVNEYYISKLQKLDHIHRLLLNEIYYPGGCY